MAHQRPVTHSEAQSARDSESPPAPMNMQTSIAVAPSVPGVLAGPRNADDPNQLNPRMCMDMVDQEDADVIALFGKFSLSAAAAPAAGLPARDSELGLVSHSDRPPQPTKIPQSIPPPPSSSQDPKHPLAEPTTSTAGDPPLRPVAHSDGSDTIAIAACGAFLYNPSITTSPPVPIKIPKAIPPPPQRSTTSASDKARAKPRREDWTIITEYEGEWTADGVVHHGRRDVDDVIDHVESLVAVVALPDGEVQMRPVVALSDIPPPVPIKISRNVPPPPAKPPPPANTFAEDDGEVQMRPVALSESPAAAGPLVPKKVSGKAPPPPIPYVEISEEQMCENIHQTEEQMCENIHQSGRRMLIEAMMSPEGYRYMTSPEGYRYIMSLPPPTPEIAEEVMMMQRMRQDGLERVSTAMMSPEGYQWIKAQPVIAPSETPGSPPHSLVEPAPSTGPLAGGLEMLPHSPSPWSRLDTPLDASLERLSRIEEEWGILVHTDDYGDDAKAMEDCFRPHNYKKAHRANPRPPHTHK